MTTVFVVDDQAMVRESFVALLGAQPGIEVVGSAADGADAVTQVEHLHPDVVLMDVRMPTMDGLEATRRLRDHPCRIIVLTTYHLDEYVHEALRAGADGYLLKDAPAAELVQAVHVVARGDALLSPAVTRRLLAEFTRHAPPLVRPAALERLTARETDVLRRLARGLSNVEIAAALGLSEQTVKTHVRRILAKLGARDRAQAIVISYESGLVTARVP
ncbi:DNA-binding response regulator [Lentzea guizhouensis]|uniref:DNA-binding response regulator n=1 Tax=Lentzea guizhouensis TaxID=1586287 RepID=A0A1B2HQZ3_9PSEU|nr:response regulator transcription factor [Lentzea guizhouensis]ANZ40150.1 DNA-binding response regulator [Lentzea guizhouensis]